MVKYSWILPIYNEAESLPRLIKSIEAALPSSATEIIAVNDASFDLTAQILDDLARGKPYLKIITFSSHLGKWAALQAGFSQAVGQAVITIDADLQNVPEEAPKLLAKLAEGYDIVSGARLVRHDPGYKIFISRIGNFLSSTLTGKHFKDLNSPFKVYRPTVLASLPKEGSLLRFSLLFAHKLGYRVAEVPVTHRPRRYGRSKFGLVKYIRIIYDLMLIILLFTGSGRLTKTKNLK